MNMNQYTFERFWEYEEIWLYRISRVRFEVVFFAWIVSVFDSRGRYLLILCIKKIIKKISYWFYLRRICINCLITLLYFKTAKFSKSEVSLLIYLSLDGLCSEDLYNYWIDKCKAIDSFLKWSMNSFTINNDLHISACVILGLFINEFEEFRPTQDFLLNYKCIKGRNF